VTWVELGRIGAPYGIKGWVHVDSYTDPPEGLLRYPRWTLRQSRGQDQGRRELTLAQGRPHGDRLVARLEGIEDRTAAATLTGAAVEIERSALPPPKEREYYCADLEGCEVSNLEGVALGTLVHFVAGPTGMTMVVREPGGREHWVPAVPRHLRKVDLPARKVLVDWTLEEGEEP
jgi:16S rRNA processing protein RimM